MSAFAARPRPPAQALKALSLLLAVGALVLVPARAQEEPKPSAHRDEIDVTRILVDARVLDSDGHAIEGLDLTNFRVRIGGERAIVESVEWIEGTARESIAVTATATTRRGPQEIEPIQAEPGPGRLVVFFFQRDLDHSRIVGLMKMVKRAQEMLDTLEAEDQVAVLCYDSHLRLYGDFTTDREETRRILENSIVTYEDPDPLEEGPFPSLAAYFDEVAAKNAPNPERALWVIGQALGELPGPKSMIFFGWGLGRIVGGSFVQLRAEYSTALRALTDARVTVFSLDVTNADYHTLEGPLRTVALDTGGFYVKTHLFSEVAIERVVRAIAGHYLLTVKKPQDLGPGRHDLRVRLRGVSGTVHARRWVDP